MSLQAVVELVDKMSGPLKSLTSLVGEFATGVKAGAKAELELQESGKKAAKEQDNLATSLKGVGQALLALSAFKQIFDGFAGSIAAADKMDDLSDKTKIAAHNLRGYALAADQSGITLDALVKGLDKLNLSLSKTTEETGLQTAAFEALGITSTNVDGTFKSAEQTFGEIADKFKGMKDGPEKAALAFNLLGESGLAMIPLLNKGAAGIKELKDEALILGQQGTAQFDAFAASAGTMYDGIGKVNSVMEGLFNVISAEVVPIFNVLIDSFIDSFKSGGLVAQIFDAIKVVAIGALIPAIKSVIHIFRGFTDVIALAGKSLGALGAIIAAVASGDISGAKAIWKSYKEDVAQTSKEHVQFTDKLWDSSNASNVAAKALEGLGNKALGNAPKLKKLGTAAKEIKSELEALVASLTMTNDSFGQDESAKARLDAAAKYQKDIKAGVNPIVAKNLLIEAQAQIARNKSLREGKEAQDNYVKALTTIEGDRLKVAIMETELRTIGLSKSERDKAVQVLIDEAEVRAITNGLTGTSKEQIEKEIKAIQERRAVAKDAIGDHERLNGLMSGTFAEQSTKALDDVTFLYKAYQEGRIKSEGEYVEAVNIRLSQLKDNNQKAADEITIFWQEAAKGMQSSMSDFFFDAMQGKISSLGDRFKSMMDRMVADALAANLADAMFGKGFGKSGSMGGFVGQAASFIGGLFSGARANGGPVQAGKMYMVGEKGPEPFIPSVSGTIIPNSALNAGGSQSNVQINITAMDSQDVRRALEKDNRWIADMVNKSSRAYNLGAT